MNVSVRSIFTEILFLPSHGVTGICLLRVHDNTDLQFEALGYLEPMHALHCDLGVPVTPKFDNRMTFVLSSHLVLWQINCINQSERFEEFADFQVSETAKCIYETTHVHTIVLLAPRMMVLRR